MLKHRSWALWGRCPKSNCLLSIMTCRLALQKCGHQVISPPFRYSSHLMKWNPLVPPPRQSLLAPRTKLPTAWWLLQLVVVPVHVCCTIPWNVDNRCKFCVETPEKRRSKWKNSPPSWSFARGRWCRSKRWCPETRSEKNDKLDCH